MGRYYLDGRKDVNFPDEFGRNLCNPGEAETPEFPGWQPGSLPPFCGYVTPQWFGPFLLSPFPRKVRGRC